MGIKKRCGFLENGGIGNVIHKQNTGCFQDGKHKGEGDKEMNINEEYAMEMLLSGHLKGKEIGDGYIVAFMYECQITNPERLDRWLLNNGYLRKPTIKETLSRYKVPELKEFLSKKGMKVTGKKAELIERLVSVLSESDIKSLLDSDKRYYLSEKGLKHYYDNIDLNELHRNWKYRIQLNEYFKYRKANGAIRGFYETAYLALQEKIKNGVVSICGQNRITTFDFMNFSEICEKLEMNTDSIKAVLMALYIETNLVEDSYTYFDKDWIERDGIDGLCRRIDQNQCMIFNRYITQRIVELSEYYSEYMVDEIYKSIKLQYVLFDKRNFKAAVDDMIQSAYFECSPYMRIIKDNYREIATHILKDKNAVSFASILKFLRGK